MGAGALSGHPAAAITAARAQSEDNDGCTDRTIQGDYAFRISGFGFDPTGTTIMSWRDGVALTHFDGAGGLKQVDFVLTNGTPGPGHTDPVTGFRTGQTGTYQVNPDCTGKAEIDSPPPPGQTSGAVIKLMFVIANQGRTLHAIVSSLVPPGAPGPVPVNTHSDAERVLPAVQ